MKPVIIGLLVGSAVGLYLAMLYLYSLWLPSMAVAVLASGLISLSLGGRFKPSVCVSALLIITYFCIFWIPPEVESRTASTPEDHYQAAIAIGGRAQIFGDDQRELEHFMNASDGAHPAATFVMASYYDYGYNQFTRNESKAMDYYKRASELGYQDQGNRLEQLTEYNKKQNKSEQATPRKLFD